MLGIVTGRAINAQPAAAWLRRLAMVLAVLATVVAVRGPLCPDGMTTGPSGMPSESMVVDHPAVMSGPETRSASMPVALCPALMLAVGRSTVDLGSCMQAPPMSVGVSGASAWAADRDTEFVITSLVTAPQIVRAAVLRHAATLHQLGLLRT